MISLLSGVEAHPSGALFLPHSQTALIADVHLGYSWAQRRRGELGPLADFAARDRLTALCQELQPKRIVFVGDLVHAPRPCEPERAFIEQTLHTLAEKAELVSVRGNHDRAFAREFGHLPVSTSDAWREGGLVAIHGDRLIQAENETVVLGHFHPSLNLREASGAKRRALVWLANRHCIAMPAFSPFAVGFEISDGLPEPLAGCFGEDPIAVFAASSARVAALGSLDAVVAKIRQATAQALPGSMYRFARPYRG